jgi:putative ABC transport system ATP-binding protein
MPLVELRGASKQYGSGSGAAVALHPLDLAVEAGEFLCVAGPSGSGKTTLLNLVGAMDVPSSGTVLLDGRSTSGLSRSQRAAFRLGRIGFVFQSYNLVPVLTAYENVEYVLLLQRVGTGERRRRVLEALESVGVADQAAKRPGEMSGGQQQRVAVARAIAGLPSLVVADEPTANLDSESGGALLDLLHGLNRRRGTTFVYSSHDPRVIRRASRVVTLRDGSLAADGNP